MLRLPGSGDTRCVICAMPTVVGTSIGEGVWRRERERERRNESKQPRVVISSWQSEASKRRDSQHTASATFVVPPPIAMTGMADVTRNRQLAETHQATSSDRACGIGSALVVDVVVAAQHSIIQ